MSANFLHGAETVEITAGPRPIRQVKTAVIGLVGTMPVQRVAEGDRKVNEAFLVLSDTDAGRLAGPDLPGYTIPQALNAIFDQGRGTVVCINVFDPARHKTAMPAAPAAFGTDDTIVLAHQDVSGVVVKSADDATTYQAGTHYAVDAVAGTVARLAVAEGGIAAGATVNLAYGSRRPTR